MRKRPPLRAQTATPDPIVREGVAVLVAARREQLVDDDARAASWLDFELARHRALGALDDQATRLAEALPVDREAAAAQLRGVAYGVNEEDERAGDDAPFDWRTRRYAPRGSTRR